MTAPPPPTPGADDGDDGFTPPQISTDLSAKPAVPELSGPPPDGLVAADVVEGDGTVAAAGAHVTVHYVGVSYSTGRQFDASWDRGAPFDFPLGAGRVIQGWDDGVAGMKEGGRRTLVIPPRLGYGPRAMGPIRANETLVFVVDLVKVER